MSISINTNIPAMTALQNVTNVYDQLQTNTTRLSSGLKINSAGDDPSGLVLSQQLKNQIAGIAQAMSNTQNATNLAKTADGGLSQIQSILQSMRTIAVQAANVATQGSQELAAEQQQIASSIQSIDTISSSTEWAGNQLLNGAAGVQANIVDTTDAAGLYMSGTFNGLPVASGPVTVQLTSSATQSSLTTNGTFTATSAIVPAGAFSINGTTFTTNGATQTVQDVINSVNADAGQTGVMASAVTTGPNVSVAFTSVEYGSKFPISFNDSQSVLDTAPVPSPTLGTDAVATVTVPVSTTTGPGTSTATFTGGTGPTQSGIELADSSGNVLRLTSTGNSTTDLSAAPVGIGSITAGPVQFQIGDAAGQMLSFSIPSTSSNSLGTGVVANQNLSTINVTSQQGAGQAISIIDAALSQISTIRGNIGAVQANILTPTISNLTSTNQNLAAANSSVSDVDMAAELTDYTKNQVLEQSGMAVLAQANTAPSQALQLLKNG